MGCAARIKRKEEDKHIESQLVYHMKLLSQKGNKVQFKPMKEEYTFYWKVRMGDSRVTVYSQSFHALGARWSLKYGHKNAEDGWIPLYVTHTNPHVCETLCVCIHDPKTGFKLKWKEDNQMQHDKTNDPSGWILFATHEELRDKGLDLSKPENQLVLVSLTIRGARRLI
jgi:hypothetical protein